MPNYEPIRVSDFQVEQLDRVEKKMDRILELLEGQELSTSVEIDAEAIVDSLRINLLESERQFSSKTEQISSRCY